MRPGPSDEQLLRMLHEVEDIEEIVADVAEPGIEAPSEDFDPCSYCGEPAQHSGTCHICNLGGCLPPDLWTPGMRDPCLGLCVRCARTIHLACATEDEAGNPRCPRCHY